MSVEVVLQHACSTVGEGPHWDAKTQSLLYVDILCGDVHRYNTTTKEDSKLSLGEEPIGVIVPCAKGGYLLGRGRTISHLESWENPKITVLEEVDQGTKNRFNDGKCDPSGRFWAGTMGHETVPAQPERQMGSLFSLDADRKFRTHVSKIDISNGLAWTADNKTMYYIDSVPRKVYAFDYDITKGDISNQRVAVDFGEGTVDTLGYPDGMAIDVEDKIWVACFSAGKVVRFDPETGKELQTVNIPNAKKTTSCCFGGPNLDEMYVTCSKYSVTDEAFKGEESQAGSIFKVTGLGVKGYAGVEFAG